MTLSLYLQIGLNVYDDDNSEENKSTVNLNCRKSYVSNLIVYDTKQFNDKKYFFFSDED